MSTSKQNILNKITDKNKKPSAAKMFAEEMKNEEVKDEIRTESKEEVHTDDVVSEKAEVKRSTFIDSIIEKEKKKTIEDTHTRSTFLVHNDLLSRMDKLSKKRKRGFKTELVNHAIKDLLDEIEGK